jgi:hypothetical protein
VRQAKGDGKTASSEYLTTVVQDKHFAVLEGGHGSGIGVEVWICITWGVADKQDQKRH